MKFVVVRIEYTGQFKKLIFMKICQNFDLPAGVFVALEWGNLCENDRLFNVL